MPSRGRVALTLDSHRLLIAATGSVALFHGRPLRRGPLLLALAGDVLDSSRPFL